MLESPAQCVLKHLIAESTLQSDDDHLSVLTGRSSLGRYRCIKSSLSWSRGIIARYEPPRERRALWTIATYEKISAWFRDRDPVWRLAGCAAGLCRQSASEVAAGSRRCPPIQPWCCIWKATCRSRRRWTCPVPFFQDEPPLTDRGYLARVASGRRRQPHQVSWCWSRRD